MGLIATAPAASDSGTDFVSRYFAPKHNINEDPVPGSAHSTLIPYWAKMLGKKRFLPARSRRAQARSGAKTAANGWEFQVNARVSWKGQSLSERESDQRANALSGVGRARNSKDRLEDQGCRWRGRTRWGEADDIGLAHQEVGAEARGLPTTRFSAPVRRQCKDRLL